MTRKRTVAIVTGAAAATLGMLTVPWSALADQVILDDLIVDGSACVGFDCVNGESFGFDTVRLKENNLRIRFQDTSTTASFPSNDWQLTANDTANGGANKFSIDDVTGGKTPFTVEAGARTNALFVESDGDVGFGTNNPTVNLHSVDGNTPTLRLEQDGTSGFTPQTWDMAGNEANFFIRDATNGSTLPFRIKPGAPSDALTIDADGNVGMGTSDAADMTPLDIQTSGVALFSVESTDDNAVQWRIQSDSTNRRLVALDGAGNTETQIVLLDNGAIEFVGPTTGDPIAQLDSSGNLHIEGVCTQGTPAVPCGS